MSLSTSTYGSSAKFFLRLVKNQQQQGTVTATSTPAVMPIMAAAPRPFLAVSVGGRGNNQYTEETISTQRKQSVHRGNNQYTEEYKKAEVNNN